MNCITDAEVGTGHQSQFEWVNTAPIIDASKALPPQAVMRGPMAIRAPETWAPTALSHHPLLDTWEN
ncbi:hypothetical protein R1flu_023888 [Riccia fluitans]|uniref:Uncharacterized protein n=1 Tax=Riccia fluitans TaxID=41844 RepID=A0ABD1XW88_9MARC